MMSESSGAAMTDSVSAEMRARIGGLLDEIAETKGVTILLAVESGSRAWGFHSPDSDYDVRFLYARPVEWHLSVRDRRDVIERPVDAVLDVSGWELRKALRLALKSNAVVAEWLQSPIVYAEAPDAREALTGFTREVLDRAAVSWHYLSLLRGQIARAQTEGGIRLKRYFYALRPALALRWMRLNAAAMPPMHMDALVDAADLSRAEMQALATLTKRKKRLAETGADGAADPLLDALIAGEKEQAETWLKSNGRHLPTAAHWDAADALHRAWTLRG
jgi:predicted nucleotidyltransferase